MPLVSVIICTIRRIELYGGLIDTLQHQTWQNLEVMIIGRQGERPPKLPDEGGVRIRWSSAPKGLAPARNVGLAQAKGDYIAFLDDDVVIEKNFVETAVEIFERPTSRDVGGLTGFDLAGYGCPVSWRWKLRKLLGITPSLKPGDSSHLGRSVTLAFFHPFSGCREVKWMPGFCQIFRRTAIEGLRYDEKIIVEDRDFSMEVGRNWRLMICGDLKLKHLMDGEGRHSQAFQTWRAAFGLGRSFAKRARSWRDAVAALHVLAGEFVLDLLVLIRRPSLGNGRVAISRARGFVSGYASWNVNERDANVRAGTPAGISTAE